MSCLKLSSTLLSPWPGYNDSVFNWFNYPDVLNNLLATLIWVIIAGIVGVIFRVRIARLLRRVLPQIDSSIPHVDFTFNYNEHGDLKSDIIISNNGGEPAYNVYVFLYTKSFVGADNYTLKSLGNSNVRSGVLGVAGIVEFKGVDLAFAGCSITSKEEIWIEYDNAVGVHFRTVVIPPTPRGDSLKVNPPKVIKERLEMMPGFDKSYHDKEWKKYEKGKQTLFPRRTLITRIKYMLNKLRSRKKLV